MTAGTLTENKYQTKLNFWENYIKGIQDGYFLRANNLQVESGRKTLSYVIESHLESHIRQLVQKDKSGAYLCILFAIGTVLNKYSILENAVVNIPCLKGCEFDQVFPLCIEQDANYSIRYLLNNLNKRIKDCYYHQDFQLRIVNKNNLFSNILVTSSALHANVQDISHDLIIDLQYTGEDLTLEFDYDTVSFDSFFIEEFANHISEVLKYLKNIDTIVKQIDILSLNEKNKLYTFSKSNQSEERKEREENIIQIFDKIADLYPCQKAVVAAGTFLTYKELKHKANQLACHLIKSFNVGTGDIIGIMADYSERMIIAMLAILKAGAAYLPVDIDLPDERKAFMISDAGVKLLLSDSSIFLTQNIYSGDAFLLDIECELLTAATSEIRKKINQPSDLAYVIYTSGSTGSPKGVMIEHKGLANMILCQIDYFQLHHSDIIFQFASVSFDASVSEIFMSLCSGAQLHITEKLMIKDPSLFGRYLQEQKISVLTLPPAYLKHLAKETLSSLRVLISAGERIDIERIFQLDQRLNVFNAYGPTEATVCATINKIDASEDIQTNNSIGRPIWNTQLYVLDGDLNLVPVGITGEICIGGIGLARGYLNNPQLTQEKFVANPLRPGERLYRTGDLGRWLADGNVEYLGRKDDQVKIRGYRIELGEIEGVLGRYEGIRACVVTAYSRQPESGLDKELVAYVVSDEPVETSRLRAYLAKYLPSYMLPSHYVNLDSLPLTSNGKVDKKRLPVPGATTAAGSVSTSYAAPRNDVETRLVQVWEDVLGKTHIGINDDFFELGGHSLKATRLASQIYKSFDVKVDLSDLFTRTILLQQAELIREAKKTLFESIPLAPVLSGYPLSSSQRRLWILSHFEGSHTAYNIPSVHLLEGNLDRQRLGYAFEQMLLRHEILRTVFREAADGEVRQIIQTETPGFYVRYEDMRSAADAPPQIETLIRSEAVYSFDLSTGPLLRALLLQVRDDQWLLIYTMHHIISDGWSTAILIRELLFFYNLSDSGTEAALPPLRIQYKDYAYWQREQLSNNNKDAERYWQNRFSGELPVLPALGDKVRPAVKTYNGKRLLRQLSAEGVGRLQQIIEQEGCTLFMGLLAAVNMLLYRYTGQEDIIIGSPIANRLHPDLEDQIGFYINTLVLRTLFSGANSYRELLRIVKSVTMEAYHYQSYPFDELVDILDLQRDLSRSPLFDVMVVLQNTESVPSAISSDLTVKDYEYTNHVVSKFDVMFTFSERTNNRLQLEVEYNSDIFSEASAVRLADHFEQLLLGIAEMPDGRLCEIGYLSADERRQLLEDFNDTEAAYQSSQTLIDLFEHQAAERAEQVAVVFGQTHFSYRFINEASNQLGHYLRLRYGIKKDDLVGISLQRSEWLIIAVLGVLKSGAAYVPIDPDYPASRIEYITENSGCKLILDQTQLDLFKESAGQYPLSNPEKINQPSDLAYVIYTSGSTGSPKGVMIEHTSVINRIEWMWKYYQFTDQDIILQKTTFTFDVSVWEIFMPLCFGARMVVCSKEDVLSPENILRLIESHYITCLHFVPSVLNAFILSLFDKINVSDRLQSLRYVITSGEALPLSLTRIWYEKTTVPVCNLYGPTEASVDVSHYEVLEEDERIPVGRPIWNTQLYVLDGDLNLVPVGITGEICIGGIGLARGYLNNPQLTQEKFVANPLRPGERLYRTGDLGRWLADGNVEYLGRKDDQVKIRGYRIELGEIEGVLGRYEGIRACVVTAYSRQPESGLDKELVAYVVSDEPVETSRLRAYLAKYLPSYMLPSHYVNLDSLPLTSNGKVDKKRLPVPGATTAAGSVSTSYAAPRNDVETRLVQVWEDVLGKTHIGINDDFFELGGHSLKATRLASQIYKSFDVKVDLSDLFTRTILLQQAELIREAKKTLFESIPLAPVLSGYPLSSSQRRLWILSHFEGSHTAYNIPSVHLLEGNLDRQRLGYAFEQMLLRHEILRTVFREAADGEVRQIIQTETPGFYVRYEDMRSAADAPPQIETLIRSEAVYSFDLSTGPLLRALLLQVRDDQWLLIYTMHHIISDGWSTAILIRELLFFYNLSDSGTEAALPPLRIQYKDYAYWQREQLSNNNKDAERYWQNRFSGELPVLPALGDKVRPAVKTYNGKRLLRQLSAEGVGRLQQIIEQEGCTLFMGLLAAVNMLLYRYTGQEDIIIGSPIANRLHPDLEDQIGFYINTLVLRTLFSGANSYRELLRIVKSVTMEAYHYQSYPFDELVDILDLQRDLSRSPLFDVMVVLQNTESVPSAISSDLTVKDYEYTNHVVSKFDVMFTFSERTNNRLQLEVEYNSDIFSEASAVRLADHFEQLLLGIAEMPDGRLCEIGYLSADERRQLLEDFNDTEAAYQSSQTLIDLFEHQAAERAEQVAVVFGQTHFSYRFINEASNQLGHYLRLRYGIKKDDLVGISLQRSEWLIIAVLGVLKSGAAYVPIDPDYPASRIEYITENSGCKLILDQTQLDLFKESAGQYPLSNPEKINQPSDLAYVIYTSGSTGSPKGVMIEHTSVINRIEWMWKYYQFTDQDIILQKTTFTFDVSVWEIFMPLCFGARMVVCSKEDVLSPENILRLIESHYITCLHFVPSVLNAFILSLFDKINVSDRLQSLRYVITSGEALPLSLTRIWYEKTTVPVCNLYGPTEASVDVSHYEVLEEDERIPVGRPIWNTQLYVLDGDLNLVPVGITGEICIGGIGLARGYLNNPQLTQEKFVANPLRPGERLYRTGDLGRWLADGNVEYLGRKDDQVKIRGYRIELGEIEGVLGRYEGIRACVVTAYSRQPESGLDKELVAYVVSDEPVETSRLRAYLAKYLPSYMLPSHYVNLDSLPLTSNGKVDKKRLPVPGATTAAGSVSTSYAAPRNDVETRLVQVWEDVLGKTHIGINDDFFELGGDSIKVIKLHKLMNETFPNCIQISQIFSNPSISGLIRLMFKDDITPHNKEIARLDF